MGYFVHYDGETKINLKDTVVKHCWCNTNTPFNFVISISVPMAHSVYPQLPPQSTASLRRFVRDILIIVKPSLKANYFDFSFLIFFFFIEFDSIHVFNSNQHISPICLKFSTEIPLAHHSIVPLIIATVNDSRDRNSTYYYVYWHSVWFGINLNRNNCCTILSCLRPT